MLTNNSFENKLDEIRIALNEKTKTLSKEDAVASINSSGRKIAEKYGITVVKPETAFLELGNLTGTPKT